MTGEQQELARILREHVQAQAEAIEGAKRLMVQLEALVTEVEHIRDQYLQERGLFIMGREVMH